MRRDRKTSLRGIIGIALVLALGIAAIAYAAARDSSDGGGEAKDRSAKQTKAKRAKAGKAQRGKARKGKPVRLRKGRKKKRRFRARPARLQRRGSMRSIEPRPQGKQARDDRGAIWERGCMILPPDTKAKPCVFGRRKAKRSMVLFGDSHAMALFGAANRLAKRRGMRLVAQTKAGCGPLTVPVYNHKVDGPYRQCAKWHRGALRLIKRADPRIIVVAAALTYKPMPKGRIVENEQRRQKLLVDGYREMLKYLVEKTDARVFALRDLPMAPHDMTDCVGANLKHLKRCSFRKPKRYGKFWGSRAVRSVDGVEEVDISRAMCNKHRCFGVVHNKLVYRDNDHMTATFSRSVAPWLARGIRRG